jgi:predicted nucleotidyltransferase
MLKNTLINRAITLKIAHALGELNERVVFVGGAVVSLYINDPAADDVRPTQDIDFIMEIAHLAHLESVRENLIQKGFYQTSEDNVICRFRYEDIKVDVMATKAIGWAPANPWFEAGFNHLVQFDLDGRKIRCLSLPYFLASKFAAFYSRGTKDPRTSKDMEDIAYILNHRLGLAEEVLSSSEEVKQYLRGCFQDIIDDQVKQEAILGNLFFEDQDLRFNKIMNTLKQICHGFQRTQ